MEYTHFTDQYLRDCVSHEEVGSAFVECFNAPYALVDVTVCIFLRMFLVAMKYNTIKSSYSFLASESQLRHRAGYYRHISDNDQYQPPIRTETTQRAQDLRLLI
ncbi:hypothetical protein EVAR_98763_1 [Eumeta japonica]|uniref:Uncharacterized protein n=1 Tax=Eumeta variegata TaxID=151549 RepID=A0A4C1YXC9_EUMVA|nr:hypothetical protein EVAR_98763_1 [Eumeta japonica]